MSYRDLTRDAPADGRGYVFEWTWKTPPAYGNRVIVPGVDGPAYGVVLREGTAAEAGVGTIKPITRLVTAAEIAKAEADERATVEAFWEQARIAAGLATGRARSVEYAHLELTPADGTATAAQADERAREWSKIARRAETEGRPAHEVARYSEITLRWRAVKKKGGNA